MRTTRSRLLARLVVGLALVGGCTSHGGTEGYQPSTPGQGEIAPVTAGLKVAADDPARLDGPSATRLPLLQVRDLLMRLQLPAMPADPTLVVLKLVNPNGVQVQRRQFAFSATPSMAYMPMAELSYPLPVTQVHHIPGGVALDFSIPVAGTNLVRRPMPGTWHLVVDAGDVHLDQTVALVDLTEEQ